MKIRGRKLAPPSEQVLVIPRPSYEVEEVDEKGQPVWEVDPNTNEPVLIDGQKVQKKRVESGDLVIRARAIVNYDEFEKLVPEPKVPHQLTRGETKPKPNPDNPNYVKAMEAYGKMRGAYLIVKSMEPTVEAGDWEWEQVKMDDPKTWELYKKEFEEAGLSPIETGRIIQLIMDVNGMDDAKFEEAKQRFLRGRAGR